MLATQMDLVRAEAASQAHSVKPKSKPAAKSKKGKGKSRKSTAKGKGRRKRVHDSDDDSDEQEDEAEEEYLTTTNPELLANKHIPGPQSGGTKRHVAGEVAEVDDNMEVERPATAARGKVRCVSIAHCANI